MSAEYTIEFDLFYHSLLPTDISSLGDGFKIVDLDEYSNITEVLQAMNTTYPLNQIAIDSTNHDLNSINLLCNTSTILNEDFASIFNTQKFSFSNDLTLYPSKGCNSLVLAINSNEITIFQGEIKSSSPLKNLFIFSKSNIALSQIAFTNIENVHLINDYLPESFAHLDSTATSKLTEYLNNTPVQSNNIASDNVINSPDTKLHLYFNNTDTFGFVGEQSFKNTSLNELLFHHKNNQDNSTFFTGNFTANFPISVWSNQNTIITLPVNSTSFSLFTEKNFDIDSNIYSINFFASGQNGTFSLGECIITNSSSFDMRNINSTLEFIRSSIFITTNLNLNTNSTYPLNKLIVTSTLISQNTSEKIKDIVVKPEGFGIIEQENNNRQDRDNAPCYTGSAYKKNSAYVDRDGRPNPPPLPKRSGVLSAYQTILQDRPCDSNSEELNIARIPSSTYPHKLAGGDTSSTRYYSNGHGMVAKFFTEQRIGGPSPYLSLGHTEGSIELIEVTNGLFEATLKSDDNSNTTIVEHQIALNKIIDARFICQDYTIYCYGLHGSFDQLFIRALQYVGIPIEAFISERHQLSDGIFKFPYSHLPASLNLKLESGNFDIKIQNSTGIYRHPKHSDAILINQSSDIALSTITGGAVRIPFYGNNALQNSVTEPQLNPSRPVTPEHQTALPTLSRDYLEQAFVYDNNSGSKYVYVSKVFSEYNCEYSIEKLLSELSYDSSNLSKIICPQKCTNMLIEDALFQATGSRRFEDFRIALKELFENNDATYAQKQCFEMELLIKQAVEYSKEYNFNLGEFIDSEILETIQSPFIWLVNTIMEKDGQKIPTLIPVLYLPKDLLANSSGFKYGATLKLYGGTGNSSVRIEAPIGGVSTKDGVYKFDGLLFSHFDQIGGGTSVVHVDNLDTQAQIDVKFNPSGVSSHQLTFPTISTDPGGNLWLNVKNFTAAGVNFIGNTIINATNSANIFPSILATAFTSAGEWGHFYFGQIKNIPSKVNGALTIFSNGTQALVGVVVNGGSSIYAWSKTGIFAAPALDQTWADERYNLKKKGILNTEIRVIQHSYNTFEFIKNNFGSMESPAHELSFKSDGNITAAGISVHSMKITFISNDRIIALPATAINWDSYKEQVTKIGFLGFDGLEMKTFEQREDLLNRGYTIVKLSEFHNYGNEKMIFNATNGVSIPGGFLKNYQDGTVLDINSTNGSVDLGFYKDICSWNNQKSTIQTISQGLSVNFDEAVVYFSATQNRGTSTDVIRTQIPTIIESPTVSIDANKTITLGGFFKYENLDANADTIEIVPRVEISLSSFKKIATEALLKFGFYNNIAGAVRKCENAADAADTNAVNFAFALGDAVFSMVKAYYMPVSLDLVFELKYQQNEWQVNNINYIPSVIKSSGTTILKANNVIIEGAQIAGTKLIVKADAFKLLQTFNLFEVSSESKGASGRLSVLDGIALSAGINFNKLREEGKIANNLFIKLSESFEVDADTVEVEGYKIEAKKVVMNMRQLIMKSVYDILKREGYGGSFSASTKLDMSNYKPKLQSISAEVQRGDTHWITQLASIIGTESVNIVIKESFHNLGGLVAQAKIDENGKLQDGGNLEIKALDIFNEHLDSYINGFEFGAGIDFDTKHLHSQARAERINLLFGMTDKEKETYATIGRGKIEGNIHGDLNRDINARESEEGFEIETTRMFYQDGFFDTISSAAKDIHANPSSILTNVAKPFADTAAWISDKISPTPEPKLTIWDVIDYDASEDEALRDILKENKAPQPSKSIHQIKEDIACVDVHKVLTGNPDMQEVSVKLYQHMVKNGVDENEALAILGNSLIKIHENPFVVAQPAALQFVAGAATVMEACAANPACVNLVALTLTGAYAAGKIMVEGFDVAEEIDTTMWTPETKLDIKDEGFVPVDIDTRLPGFAEGGIELPENEGFVIPEGIDTTILAKLTIKDGKVVTKEFDLKDSEGGKHGGHSEERHIGKDDKYLVGRKIPEATTFPDYKTANEAVKEVLKHNNDEIVKWAKDDSERKTKGFEAVLDSKSIGHGITKDGVKFNTNKVKIVLIKVGKDIEVLTSYPIK